MPSKELTIAQRSTLLTLMIKASPLPNVYLRNKAKINLDKAKRDALVKDKLIVVTEKPLILELTEDGWAEAIKEMGAEIPPRAGALGGTLYILLEVIRDHLDRNELSAADFFTSKAPRAAARSSSASDLEARIRKAYGELASRPGEFVMLAPLRRSLPDVSRQELDAGLARLFGAPDVVLVPESNQKVLGQDERDAAVSIGNQDKHLISITS